MKKFYGALIAAVFCVTGLAGVSHAGCTQEELQAKVQEFSTNVQAMAQKDPQKYQEAMLAMQKDLPELQKNAQDMDKVCEFYDTWNAKLK
jgi:outer membrane murein-binding lipoprotein Lpp